MPIFEKRPGVAPAGTITISVGGSTHVWDDSLLTQVEVKDPIVTYNLRNHAWLRMVPGSDQTDPVERSQYVHYTFTDDPPAGSVLTVSADGSMRFLPVPGTGAAAKFGVGAPTGTPVDGQLYVQTTADGTATVAIWLGISGVWTSASVLGGLVSESNLDSALAAKINTRLPGGRVAVIPDLATTQTLTISETDNQGQVDATVKLIGNGVLTISGIQTVQRCTIRLIATQDATGNRTLSIKNGLNGDQVAINVDPAINAESFIYCYTDDGAILNVVGPDTSVATGGGSGGGSGIAKPNVTGTLGGTNTLTAVPPTGLLPSTIAYQWRQSTDGGTTFTDISGATSNIYTQSAADSGHKMLLRVSGTPYAESDIMTIPALSLAYVDTIQQTTSTSSSMRVNKPAAVAVGDLMYAAITVPGQTTVTTTLPSDWAPVTTDPVANPTGRYVNTSGAFVEFIVWKRYLQADADANVTFWNFTMSASLAYRSRTIALRNAVATGIPHTAVVVANGTFNTTVTLPAKTPTANGRMYTSMVAFPANNSITWPASTVTDVSGSDYQKFQYLLLPDTTPTTAVNGTVATTHKMVASWLVTPVGG